MTTTTLRAEGFSCPSCVTKIEKSLTRVPGVAAAKVHFASGRIEVDHDSSVTPNQLVDDVAKVGYRSRVSAF
ncbi:MAG: heavy metal-associated domain-containing protein [bacterium]|nr:heavy metal-associated domain-containing protein [bacterium]